MNPTQKYKTDPYFFPSDNVSPKQKLTKEYGLAIAEAFYAQWLTDKLPYSMYSERENMMLNRKYSRGMQPDDIYFDLAYGRNDKNEIIRKGYMSVNWEILKMAIQFQDSFLSRLMGFEYDADIWSQDQYSHTEKETQMYESMVKKRLDKIFKPDQAKEDVAPRPDTMADFEILEKMGEFKQKDEYSWEKFIGAVLNGFGNWDKNLKTKLLKDIFAIGRLCVRDYVDPTTQLVKVKYVDPINSAMRLTSDGEVIDGFYMDIMTVQDLRLQTDLSEEELFNAAKMFCGQYGNPSDNKWDWGSSYINRRDPVPRDTLGNMPWYYWRIPVMHYEYMTIDTTYYTEKDMGEEKAYFRGEWGKVYKNSTTKKTHVKKQRNIYKGSWIVGTKHIFGQGLQYDMPRPSKAEARCSFHFYKMEEPSIVERCRPVWDAVQMSWLKLQNAKNKSKPDGHLFDLTVLSGMNIGDKLSAYDMIKGIMQTGSGFIRSANKRGNPVTMANIQPAIPITGGYATAIDQFERDFNNMSVLLAGLSGMNPSFMGNVNNLPEGKAINEMQSMASMALLEPKMDAYLFVRTSCARNLLLRGQVIFRNNDEISNEYRAILGDNVVDILKVASQKDYGSYGLKLTMRVSAEIRQKVESAANASLQATINGQPGITFMEYFKIIGMLESGVEIKYIQGYMDRLISKREMEAQQRQLQAIDQQNMGLAQVNQQKTQEEMMRDRMKMENDITINTVSEAVKAYFEQMKAPMDTQKKAVDETLSLMIQSIVAKYGAQQANTGQAAA